MRYQINLAGVNFLVLLYLVDSTLKHGVYN